MGDELIEVRSLIPKDQLGAYYTAVAALSSDGNTVSAMATSAAAKPDKAWREGDDEIAREVVEVNEVNAHKFLRLIAEKAGQKVSYDVIDAALGMTWNMRAGVQGALGRTVVKRGRVMPWTTDFYAKTVVMTPMVAELFLKALGDRGR
jgi:hypothetical protein